VVPFSQRVEAESAALKFGGRVAGSQTEGTQHEEETPSDSHTLTTVVLQKLVEDKNLLEELLRQLLQKFG